MKSTGKSRLPFRVFGDDGLEPRWQAIRCASGYDGKLSRSQINLPMLSRQTTRGGFVPVGSDAQQLVVTKVSYGERKGHSATEKDRFRHNMQRYARYIARDEAIEGRLFDRESEGEAYRERVDRWTGDRRYFRLSLNPKRSNDIPDVQSYTREVMAAIERKVLTPAEREAGQNLDWIAATHTNTGRTHSHVLLRGKVGNRDLFMRPQFITRGIRSIAREVASRDHHLGLRSWREIEADRSVEGRQAMRDLAREVRDDDTEMGRDVGLDGGDDE
jgi:hypothetical protein